MIIIDTTQPVPTQSVFASHQNDIKEIAPSNYKEDEHHIRIRLINQCNNDCSYCNENGDGYIASKDDFEILFDNIGKLNHKKLTFFIYGGEPTLHPDFVYFFELMSEQDWFDNVLHIEVISNLTRKINKFIDIHNILGDKLRISSSIHFDYFDKSNPLTTNIIKKCLELKKNKLPLTSVNVMIRDDHDYEYFNSVILKYNKLFKLNVEIGFIYQKCREFYIAYNDTLNPLYNVVYSNGESDKVTYIDYMANFNCDGIMCEVPHKSFIVNNDGMVSYCNTKYLHGDITKFNMFESQTEEDLKKFFSKHIKCNQQRCICEHDIRKYKK